VDVLSGEPLPTAGVVGVARKRSVSGNDCNLLVLTRDGVGDPRTIGSDEPVDAVVVVGFDPSERPSEILTMRQLELVDGRRAVERRLAHPGADEDDGPVGHQDPSVS
jgi:hypothetical protein